MTAPLLKTKLYIPPARPELVSRPRLIELLNAGLHRKLTLVSAPAGFGKTTLVSDWLRQLGVPAAWVSLDEGDNDPIRFLSYFVAALQTIETDMGKEVLSAFQSPQPPPIEPLMTTLINEIAEIRDRLILVLDDYHVIESQSIDQALTFALDHLPPHMHLIIASRTDPSLPLSRLRAGDQLTEVRATDLRFSSSETAEFLNQVMGLNLSAEDIAALETRTEGWIAGLQLATISMQGRKDLVGFIESFTGSHRFVMDYLLEEVLHQQPESLQAFLLRTSILDRLCGPLCDAVCSAGTAVLLGEAGRHPMRAATGQETLEYLEQANLFIVPLDNERRWYRYHRLFAELLRQQLQQRIASSPGDGGRGVAEYHIRASQWYEDNNLSIEAFHHAVAANDVERAQRLIGGDRIPQHFRGAVTAVLDWLESLPKTILNARPWLWWRHASLLLVNGQTTGVEEKLQAAEAALQGIEPDDESQNLIGLIAAARATLALTRYDARTMLVQSRRALEYLHTDSLISRASANWTLGYAYLFQGDRAAAHRALTESISISQAAGDVFTTILATIALGSVQEAENQLYLAAETYRRVLQLAGDQPLQIIGEAHLGLARVLYEWNDLDAAERRGQQGLQLARQYESVIDRSVSCEVFLARLKLAQGDVADAAAMLTEAGQIVRQYNFIHRIPEVAAAQVLILIHQGNLTTAADLAEAHKLPLSQARVHLAQGDPSAALAVLEPWRRQVEARDWKDEQLKVMVLQAIALHLHGEEDKAVELLGEALALAKLGGFVRLFVDEGRLMARLLYEALSHEVEPGYISRLLAAFPAVESEPAPSSQSRGPESELVEPLSEREIEVLEHIAEGLTNQEVADRLYLSIHTVKVHARNIYAKLGVKNRTEAADKGRTLGILSQH